MGVTQSRNDKVKQQYLKIIEHKKKEYYKKNKAFINSSEIKNWKEFIIEELNEVTLMFPLAHWPAAIAALCQSWSTRKDHKWRSNVVWFDFLQSYKHINPQLQSVNNTTLKVAVSAPTSSFEAQNLVQFIRSHLKHTEQHFIAAMIEQFNSVVLKLYVVPNTETKLSSYVVEDPEGTLKTLVREVRQFILLLLQCMIYYYGKLVAKMMRETPGETYDFMLQFVFTESLNRLLVNTWELAEWDKETLYRTQLKQHQ